jgi:hypothetical protein
MSNLAVKQIAISNPTGLGRVGLQFTNESGSPCKLDGYPALAFRDAAGVLPLRPHHLGSSLPETVLPNHSTFSIVSQYRCDMGESRAANKTTISLPGEAGGSTSIAGGPAICRPGILHRESKVTVTPFQSLRAAYRVSLVNN